MKWFDKWKKSESINSKIQKIEIINRTINLAEEDFHKASQGKEESWYISFGIYNNGHIGCVDNLNKDIVQKILNLLRVDVKEKYDNLRDEFEEIWNN